MRRLDKVIRSLGFNVDESIDNKSKLFVDDSAINFDFRHAKEFDVYIKGNGNYYKVGRVISMIIRGKKFIPKLEMIVDKPNLLTSNYWWHA